MPPKRHLHRGVTLIEMIVVMVALGIIVAAVVFFLNPVRQAVDVTVRAELTDIADNALQRIGRDARLALPNSVRVDASRLYLEFIPVRTAGRYRADGGEPSSGADCPATPGIGAPDSDQLSFDVSEQCFKSIGVLPDAAQIVAGSDEVVLSNYGAGFAGQDAYEAAAPNRARITASLAQATRHRLDFAARTFQRGLHDSPGKRFYVVGEPVSYVCDTAGQTLTRRWGYGFLAAQPTAFGGGSSAQIADNVAACAFDYVANVAPQLGLVTLRLTLSKATSAGTPEVITLVHAVHVRNVP
jgi:MSHA biogenesis protein MshO